MKLKRSFYLRDVLKVAPDLLGKVLVRKFDDGVIFKDEITEIEAYGGEEDLASHASKGKTERNKIMYQTGGFLYIYFIYGKHWLLNVTTGRKNHPQAILIRGLKKAKGPGRVGKILEIDKSFYGKDLIKSKRIWIEENSHKQNKVIKRAKRIGVSYAGKWADKLWRFYLSDD